MLERRGELWQYKSIFKGLDNVDLEKELNRDIQLIPTLYFLKTAKYKIVLRENGRGG